MAEKEAAEKQGHRPDPGALADWLAERSLAVDAIEPLTGDISLRQYYRLELRSGGTAVLAYYPEALRAVCRRFVNTTSLMAKAYVPVPRILATDCAEGLTVLEDAGERTVYEIAPLPWEELAPLYRQAVHYIERIQRISVEVVEALNRPLDAPLLWWEIEKSWEQFLAPRGLVGEPALAEEVRRCLREVCRLLGEGPTAPCHRDFMPRNLMPRRGAGGELLVLDHQDLRLGPVAYDLASLLNDSLFPPRELEAELVATLLPGPEGMMQYRRATFQRTLKAIGNYCEFAARGFDRHLPLVAPSFERALGHLDHLPEMAPVRARVRPLWETFLRRGDLLD